MDRNRSKLNKFSYGGRDREFFKAHAEELGKQSSKMLGLFILVMAFAYFVYGVYAVLAPLPAAYRTIYFIGLAVLAVLLIVFYTCVRQKPKRVLAFKHLVFTVVFFVLGYYNAADTASYSIFIPVILCILFTTSLEPFHITCLFAGVLTAAYCAAVAVIKSGAVMMYDILDCFIVYIMGAIIGRGLLNERINAIAVKEMQEEIRDREKLIAGLVESYNLAYEVNFTDGSCTVHKASDSLTGLGRVYTDYNAARVPFIQKLIHEQDRERMLRESDPAVIARRLRETPAYSVEFRSTVGGKNYWNEMKVTAIGGEAAAIGISEKSSEILFRRLNKKIDDDFYCLLVVDMDSEMVRVEKPSPGYAALKTGDVLPYSETVRAFAAGVKGPAREFFEKIADLDYVRKELGFEDKHTYTYKSGGGFADGEKWTSVSSYVILRHGDGTPAIFTIAFSLLDTMGADKAELQSNLEEALSFTNFFLSTYVSAYYVDLKTLECRVYKRTEELEREFPIINDYWSSLSEYIERDVHPDDREELRQVAGPEAMRSLLEHQPEYTHLFRDITRGEERIYRMQVIRGADADHAAFGFLDVTAEFREQQKRLLGAVPLSPDILTKANVGLWAFEFDEGSAPRMYADEAMLGLVGLDHQVAPEEIYHAWYDHIDAGSYDLVNDAVNKMVAGEHAEVQYPWHGPDGHTIIVRCGGVRNKEYTKGIRIEGTHQNVTEMVHYDEERVERLRKAAVQLKHEQLRSEVLNYMIDHADDDPIELLKNFAEQLRVLINCDQVIYRDLEETRIMVNSPAIEKTWSVPIEYCMQCQHFDAHHPMYAGGYTEMDNCQEGWQGIPVYDKCPIKSSLTRIVYCDGEVAGYLAIHYVQGYHHFTDTERATLEEFTRILSISLSRFKAKQESKELEIMREMQEKLRRDMEIIEALASDYSSVYYIDLDTERITPYSMNEETQRGMAQILETSAFFPDAYRVYVSRFVYGPDREMMLREARKENVLKHLKEKKSYAITFRGLNEGVVTFCEMKFVTAYAENGSVRSIALGFAYKDDEIMAQYINEKLVAEYISAFLVDLDQDHYRIYRHPESTSVMERADKVWSLAMAEFAAECDPEYYELVKNIGRPEFLRSELAEVDRREYLYRFPSASRPWRRAVIQVIDRQDGVPGTVVATFMGIDDYQSKINDQQKQLEAQQSQLKEALSMAQSANRAKTTFLNNMSHDIRTPMNAIIGYTGLAASHLDHKEQVQDYLNKIAQSSNHLLSLINDVLDMSRIESGKMNLDEKPENLSDIIHTIRNIVQADVHSKQLDFCMDALGVSDENIICDKLRLNQVLLNVLSNAIKYTAPGGTVSLRVAEKEAKREGYGSYIFTVRDNGMGMDAEFLKTIFDPFTRVKNSTVSGIQGTGLGMAITKNIINMMGGTIDIKSEPGVGTEVSMTFEFRLGSAPREIKEIPELKGVRALVVDDDSNTCLSVCRMLDSVGMREEWCTSGREAIIRAEEANNKGDSFGIFIIDCLMPNMNGIETARRIRKIADTAAPVLILTAYDWSDIEEEARLAGVTAFVSKPMFPSDLHRVLNRCLGKEEAEHGDQSGQYGFGGKRVLLVEDNELNREIATDILEEEGFTVDTAEDGDIAVEKIRAAKAGDYDLVLMDIQMPRMDGYEATRHIRALGTEISKIPILAMTANAFEEDRKQALEAGMDEHIAKPINIEKLKKTLARFL